MNAITAQQFSIAMGSFSFEKSSRIAVAVSGGGDSVALALLLQEWSAECGIKMLALTVDHGLRPESGAEAAAVQEFFKIRKIPHKILRWEGDKPESHVQERARQARYRVLIEACRAENIDTLAVAHNLEDQVETFWMRLAHGSGLDGLAGIAASREDSGIRIIRPLLGMTRADLRGTCKRFDATFIDDPSNVNPKFLRPRLRQFEEMLADEGLTPQRLAQTMRKLEDARDALHWVLTLALKDSVTFSAENDAILSRPAWLHYPEDIRRRVMAHVLQHVQPQEYPPGSDALDRLCRDAAGETFSGRTLAGCMVSPSGKGNIAVTRENAQRKVS